jgi:hypothetical protein
MLSFFASSGIGCSGYGILSGFAPINQFEKYYWENNFWDKTVED